MANLSDDTLASLKSFLAQAEGTPHLALDRNSWIFSGGDVLIITGENRSDNFLVHSSVLKKAPYFAAMFSGRWAKPKPVVVEGKKRDLWVLELYFDIETNLPLLKHQDTPIDTISRLRPLVLAGVGLDRWKSAKNDADYNIMLTQVAPTFFDQYQLPPRLQFKWSEPQIELFHYPQYVPEFDDDQATVFPQLSLQDTGNTQTYATFLDAYEEEIPHLDSEINPRGDTKLLAPCDYTHDCTLRVARKVLQMLLDLLYGNRLRLPTTNNGADAGWLCAHLIVTAKHYCVFELIAKDLEYALLSQSKNRIGRAIYNNPRFYLMLGYRLGSVPIFIDAVKHVVGPSTRSQYQRYPHKSVSQKMNDFHQWSIPRDFSEDVFPKEVVQFLIEARYDMSQAAWKTQEKLLQCLNLHTDSEHIYNSRNLMGTLHSALEDKIGSDYSQEIIRRQSKRNRRCEPCKRDGKDNGSTTYVSLCSEHNHRAWYSDVPYSTTLHSWGDILLAGHQPAWDWPPPPSKYCPYNWGRKIEHTATTVASIQELDDLDCLEIFKLHLSQEEWDVKARRAEQKRIRGSLFTKNGRYY